MATTMTTSSHVHQTTSCNFSKIDAEIATLERRIQQLRVLRNTYPLINLLPPELLREIMRLMKEDSMKEVQGSYSWIKVAQVCHHWREVALEFSTLWSSLVVPPANITWVKELCKRSRSAPLSYVDVSSHIIKNAQYETVPEGLLEEVAGVLREELHRIKVLQLYVGDQIGNSLMSQLSVPATNLDYLYIGGCRAAPTLPDDLFAGSVPNLLHLKLITCSFRWDSPLFTERIRDLRIITPKSRPQSDQVSNLLTSLPNLTSLEFGGALALAPSLLWEDIAVGNGPVRLAHLRTLCLYDARAEAIANFLTSIQMPDYHHLRLSPGRNFDKFAEHVALPIFEAKPATDYMGTNFDISLLALPIHGEIDIEFSFSFSRTGSTTSWLDLDCIAMIKEHVAPMSLHCCMILEKLPLEHLRRFSLIGFAQVQDAAYRKLSQAPNLTTLTFQSAEPGVLSAICDLVNSIPQCNVHKQERRVDHEQSFHTDGDVDEDARDSEDSDAPGSEDSASEWAAEDESTGNVEGDMSRPRQRRRVDGVPKAKDWALRGDVEPCDECRELGKAFFPSLSKLVLRDMNMLTWWIMRKAKKRMHPVAEFVVRRVRCDIRIEEITFEPLSFKNHWEYAEEQIGTDFKELCGGFTPVITVKAPVKGTAYGSFQEIEDSDSDESQDDVLEA